MQVARLSNNASTVEMREGPFLCCRQQRRRWALVRRVFFAALVVCFLLVHVMEIRHLNDLLSTWDDGLDDSYVSMGSSLAEEEVDKNVPTQSMLLAGRRHEQWHEARELLCPNYNPNVWHDR